MVATGARGMSRVPLIAVGGVEKSATRRIHAPHGCVQAGRAVSPSRFLPTDDLMKQTLLIAMCATTLLGACAGTMQNDGMGMPMASMANTKMVGGAAMYPSKDIVDNAVNSKDHTTLVAAVKAAGLVDTLKTAGPFTVFAPTNAAFSALPAGTVDTLLKPENKATLSKVLTYHVVPGRVDAAALAQQIRAGNGKAMLKTASGGNLTATHERIQRDHHR